MTHTYNINGMTCNSCVAKVKSELLKLGDITNADVQLAAPQATITMLKHISVDALQAALHKAGKYSIAEADGGMQHTAEKEDQKTWLTTYKPVLLIAGYISIIAFIAAVSTSVIQWSIFMRIFMSGFFLAFSFFKLLDLNGFADSYATYDIIAKRFRPWGFIYAFIELSLGLAYAANFNPLITNLTTFLVMSVSLIGVLQSVLNKKKIKCACLGAVFNLPMSTVTIIEDASMILMSGMMLAAIF